MSRSRPKTVPRVCWGCHNHGSCDICVGNRTRWKTRMPEIENLQKCTDEVCSDGQWPDGGDCSTCDGVGYV